MVFRSCQVAAEDPENECASQEEIDEKADKVSVSMYYKYFYFDSDIYGQKEPNGVVKYQYKPLLKEFG